MKEFHAKRRRGALLAFAAVTGGFAPAALAQQNAPPAPGLGFSNSAVARPPTGGAAKYEDAATQHVFTLDRSGPVPLMKFDNNPEVMALRATTAQRGDNFLRSDSGQLMLRVTEQGNIITYFADKDGVPADIAGSAAPFNAPPMPASLTSNQKDVAARLSKLAGHEVTIFGAGEFASQTAWAADALNNLKRGVERAAEFAANRVGELRSVRLVRGAAPTVGYGSGEMVLTVNPDAGYAGRPSSDMVAIALAPR